MIELLKPLVGGHYIVGNSFSSRYPYTHPQARLYLIELHDLFDQKGRKIGTKNGGQ